MNIKLAQKAVKKSTFSTEEDEFNELSTSALLARKSVPLLHRELANNYVLIKRIYKFTFREKKSYDWLFGNKLCSSVFVIQKIKNW